MRPVKWLTVDKWLEGSKPLQIVHQFNLPRKTVTNFVDQFVHTGRPYTEFCERQRSSTVCILQKYKNSLSKIRLLTRKGSISRVVTLDLVYSYKKLTIVPKECL